MMDIKRIIEIASELNTLLPDDARTYGLKVGEALRRAVVKKKLNFVQYLLTCTPEERSHLFCAYQGALMDADIRENGVTKEGYEDAYRLYLLMCEEQGPNMVLF